MSFLEIFQPSLRHLREERQRQQNAVDHPDAGGGAPLGIDLDAGIAVIRIPAPSGGSSSNLTEVTESETD